VAVFSLPACFMLIPTHHIMRN